jgi:hypothetical protein
LVEKQNTCIRQTLSEEGQTEFSRPNSASNLPCDSDQKDHHGNLGENEMVTGLTLELLALNSMINSNFEKAEEYLLKNPKIKGDRRVRGLLHFVQSKLSQHYLIAHQHRIEAAMLWKEVYDDDNIPCTLCFGNRAVVMNCPWNGTVCLECCNECENSIGYSCDYLE